MFIVEEKNEGRRKVGKYLDLKELECKCDFKECTFTLYSTRTVEGFVATRTCFEKPIIVTSGFRCQKHNSDVGGVLNSKHCRGLALDLQPILDEDLTKRKENLDKLEKYAKLFFDTVIRYDTFIHCHQNKDSYL